MVRLDEDRCSEISSCMTDLLFLGIDGGGTKCRARLRDAQGNLLGEGTGGPSNIRLDPDLVWNSILTACREALAQAGLQESDLGRIHAGMGAAGAGQTSAVERLLSRSHPFASFAIDTDAHTAWLGAFNGDDGAILIVGTGSCGYGGTSGQCHYVGGWGYEISDEGSGAAIGRELLRRCIWAHDGRAASTPLSDAVLAEFNNDLEILVDFVGKARPSDYGRYAPLVLQHAEQRDPLGIAIIADAATDLGRIATRLLDLGAPAICLFGGLAEPLRPWLPPPVQRTITSPAADALDGAILLARMAQPGGQP
jgi:glucosamine kinase